MFKTKMNFIKLFEEFEFESFNTDFSKKVSDVDEALDMVEKEIYEICDISESYVSQWDSSIKSSDVKDILPKIYQVQEFIQESGEDFDSKIDSILINYDNIVKNFISEMFLNNYWFSEKNDGLIDVIVELGDKIMNRYGTEPKQVINAIEGVISYFSRWLPHPDDNLIEERKKDQRYKGKKIPGKYLTGSHATKSYQRMFGDK
jgi:hypothetical protein